MILQITITPGIIKSAGNSILYNESQNDHQDSVFEPFSLFAISYDTKINQYSFFKKLLQIINGLFDFDNTIMLIYF